MVCALSQTRRRIMIHMMGKQNLQESFYLKLQLTRFVRCKFVNELRFT